MRRLKTVILFMTLLIGCGPTGTPIDASKATTVQEPKLTVGDTFTYRYTSPRSRTLTAEYQGKDPETGLLSFTWSGDTLYTKSDLSWVEVKGPNNPRTYSPNDGLLRFPLFVGRTWEQSYVNHNSSGTRNRHRSCEVKSFERFQMEFGPVDAFRISCSDRWIKASSPARDSYLYAPAIGNIIERHNSWKVSVEMVKFQKVKDPL